MSTFCENEGLSLNTCTNHVGGTIARQHGVTSMCQQYFFFAMLFEVNLSEIQILTTLCDINVVHHVRVYFASK